LSKLVIGAITTLLLALGVPAIADAAVVEGCQFPPVGGRVCVDDGSQDYGCYGTSYTGVYASTPVGGYAEVYGISEDYCDESYDFVEVRAGTLAGYEGARWASSSSGYCDTFVYGSFGFQSLGCPAGPPPNPGWGDLLP
jgi:hypothetical protein